MLRFVCFPCPCPFLSPLLLSFLFPISLLQNHREYFLLHLLNFNLWLTVQTFYLRPLKSLLWAHKLEYKWSSNDEKTCRSLNGYYPFWHTHLWTFLITISFLLFVFLLILLLLFSGACAYGKKSWWKNISYTPVKPATNPFMPLLFSAYRNT